MEYNHLWYILPFSGSLIVYDRVMCSYCTLHISIHPSPELPSKIVIQPDIVTTLHVLCVLNGCDMLSLSYKAFVLLPLHVSRCLPSTATFKRSFKYLIVVHIQSVELRVDKNVIGFCKNERYRYLSHLPNMCDLRQNCISFVVKWGFNWTILQHLET